MCGRGGAGPAPGSALGAAAIDDGAPAALDLGGVDGECAEHGARVGECLPDRESGALVEELLHLTDGGRVVPRDVGREGASSTEELLVGHDMVHESEAVRFVGVDEVPRQAHLLRAPQPHRHRQKHAHATPGDDPDASVGVAEERPLRRDQEVAPERELQAAGHASAVDRADHRLRHRPHRFDRVGPTALDGGIAASAREVRTPRAELLEVESGAERGVGSGEHHDVDIDGGLGCRERAGRLVVQGGVQRVAGLGSMQGDRAHAVCGLHQHDVAHGATVSRSVRRACPGRPNPAPPRAMTG